jgi:hypothetical protein
MDCGICFEFHRHHHHHDRRIRIVAVSPAPTVGDTQTFSVVADDPAGNLDPNAVYTWSEDSSGALATLSATDGTEITVTYVGAGGPWNLHVAATDPDGNSDTDVYTVPLILLATDVSSLSIVAGPLVPPAPVVAPVTPAEPPAA